MKLTKKRKWREGWLLGGLPGLFSALTLFLLRDALHTQTHPFHLQEGWQPFLAWMFVFFLVIGFYQRLMRRFVPPVPWRTADIRPDDPYTIAQAEMAAERSAPKI